MEGMTSNLEQEIVALQKEIEVKRAILEEKSGMTLEGREAVRAVVSEKIYGTRPATTPVQSSKAPSTSSGQATGSYLDTLDDASIEKVNGLIAELPKHGITKTIELAKKESPFILDAFHDALVDKLHDELKNRGIIK